MTKCIVIGEQPTESKKKPIEFTHFLCDNKKWAKSICVPKEYKRIELIHRGADFDIMFAYDTRRVNGFLYLGHWNDGVAE